MKRKRSPVCQQCKQCSFLKLSGQNTVQIFSKNRTHFSRHATAIYEDDWGNEGQWTGRQNLQILLPGLDPATFRSRVRHSNHWAIPDLCSFCKRNLFCSLHSPYFSARTHRSDLHVRTNWVLKYVWAWMCTCIMVRLPIGYNYFSGYTEQNG